MPAALLFSISFPAYQTLVLIALSCSCADQPETSLQEDEDLD